MTADLEFESDVRRRIYEFVERNGAAGPEEVLGAVQVESDRGGSKPPRSGVVATGPLSWAELREHVGALVDAGHIREDDGVLSVAVEAQPETYDLDGGTPVTVRLAHEADSDGVRSVMDEIVSERTSIVAESISEALDDEPVLRRTRLQSRVVFVATVGEADAESESADEPTTDGENEPTSDDENESASDVSTDETGQPTSDAKADDEVIGWVHLDAPELEKLRHTAELTVGVRSDYRERGIGSRLLDRGLEWAGEQGYHKVYQSIPATNDAAVAFLEEHGWTVEATREDHYLVDGDYVDEVMLAKDVAE